MASSISEDHLNSWDKPYGEGQRLGPDGIEKAWADIMRPYSNYLDYRFTTLEGGQIRSDVFTDAYERLAEPDNDIKHAVRIESSLLQAAMQMQTMRVDYFIFSDYHVYGDNNNQWEGNEIVCRPTKYKGKLVWVEENEPAKPIIFVLCFQHVPRDDAGE